MVISSNVLFFSDQQSKTQYLIQYQVWQTCLKYDQTNYSIIEKVADWFSVNRLLISALLYMHENTDMQFVIMSLSTLVQNTKMCCLCIMKYTNIFFLFAFILTLLSEQCVWVTSRGQSRTIRVFSSGSAAHRFDLLIRFCPKKIGCSVATVCESLKYWSGENSHCKSGRWSKKLSPIFSL